LFRFDGGSEAKKVNDNNIEKVVQKGNYLYFVTKDGKDQPLESHCKRHSMANNIIPLVKMAVPDRRFMITDD